MLLVAIATPWLIDQLQCRVYGSDLEPSAFGDQFGFSNAIFSALAFAGFLVALLMQHSELKVQNQEVADTKVALQETRDQAKKQVDALQAQIRDARYFAMIESFRSLRDEMQIAQKLEYTVLNIENESRRLMGMVLADAGDTSNPVAFEIFRSVMPVISANPRLSARAVPGSFNGEIVGWQTMRFLVLQVFRRQLSDIQATYQAYYNSFFYVVREIHKMHGSPTNVSGSKKSAGYSAAYERIMFLFSQLGPREMFLIYLFSDLPRYANRRHLFNQYLMFHQYDHVGVMDWFIQNAVRDNCDECPGDRELHPIEYGAGVLDEDIESELSG